jgi:hypothetical protein
VSCKKVITRRTAIIVIINTVQFNFLSPLKIETALCLLSLALLPACSTTSQTTAANQTLEQRLLAKHGTPEDVDHNPALMPDPLLRYSAASRTP